MKLKLAAFDFEENTLEFSVPKEFMDSHRWGAGKAEIDLSEICYNMDDTKIAPESAVTSTNSDITVTPKPPCSCNSCPAHLCICEKPYTGFECNVFWKNMAAS